MIRIELPWPDKALHPNARVHWAKKARAAKTARANAAWSTRATVMGPLKASSCAVTAIFYPPDNRRRDVDGMLASLKPSLDGIADVLGVDDSNWTIALRKEAAQPLGLVLIEIEARP